MAHYKFKNFWGVFFIWFIICKSSVFWHSTLSFDSFSLMLRQFWNSRSRQFLQSFLQVFSDEDILWIWFKRKQVSHHTTNYWNGVLTLYSEDCANAVAEVWNNSLIVFRKLLTPSRSKCMFKHLLQKQDSFSLSVELVL